MKLVHATPDRLFIGHLKNILDAEGVPYEARRDTLSSVTGDVPAQETWAEIWVDDTNAARATQFVNEAIAAGSAPALDAMHSWTCSCGERLDGEFDACWSCGKERVTE